MNETQQLDPPRDTPEQTFRQLAYLAAYDAVLDCDYAFLAYRETDAGGAWRLRIRSSQTAGAVFEPDAIGRAARAAGAAGRSWLPWGYSFDPSADDPRCIQFRVHVDAGRPVAVELFVQLRRFDGTAEVPQSVRFSWPA
ncbi:MAG: hypothetical protein KDE27_05570 [Planctomycetes bacterium]|nr:hypothetical protein [Planctomycetota bacterium]